MVDMPAYSCRLAERLSVKAARAVMNQHQAISSRNPLGHTIYMSVGVHRIASGYISRQPLIH